jgi:uncharacterized protein (DUF362 family)
MDRRDFVRTTSVGAAAALGWLSHATGPLDAQEQPKSRVAVIRSDSVQAAAGRLNAQVVERMLDRAIEHVTGLTNAAKAWGSLFGKDDVVAIKVNASAGPLLSTSPVIVAAVVKRLAEVGVSQDSIAIYDRTDGALAACGFRLNPSGAGVKCGGVEGNWDQTKRIRQGAYQGYLAQIIGLVSAIVNVPILKDAGGAGVTISMKNHFGTIQNPQDCHGGGCDPYIADVNAIPAIKDRQRLIVCDATSACFEGGPSADPRYIWRPNTVLVATDPVALDTVGTGMIDAKREQQGLKRLEAAGRRPMQLASAAARGLGTNDLARIDILEQSV